MNLCLSTIMNTPSRFTNRVVLRDVPELDSFFEALISTHFYKRYQKFKHKVSLEKRIDSIIYLIEQDAEKPLDEILRKWSDLKHNQPKYTQVQYKIEAVALVCYFVKISLGLTPYREQIKGAFCMLGGFAIELDTGEGKTLAIAIASVVRAWGGRAVHVVTANDYLAKRDQCYLLPLHQTCSIQSSHIVSSSTKAERVAAYRQDIVYTSAKEVAADFLRDSLFFDYQQLRRKTMLVKSMFSERLSKSLVQGPLMDVFIDEIDYCLIDEATTPLIISQQKHDNQLEHQCRIAWEHSSRLEASDYGFERDLKQCYLQKKAEKKVQHYWSEADKNLFPKYTDYKKLLINALEVSLFFIRNVDYVVGKGKILIVDKATGRPMENRTWRRGIHQLVELKENLDFSVATESVAQISFQHFFKFYDFVAGCSGTIFEVENELWHLYKIPVIRIPRHFKRKVKENRLRITENQTEKNTVLINFIKEKIANHQSVLVGSDSISQSEKIKNELNRHKINAQVLNALNQEEEADIIQRAGVSGKVTIGTQMMGRGSDIQLTELTRASGGLCVVATEPQFSSRLDRQFFGRCARQDDPGEIMRVYALDDALFLKDGDSEDEYKSNITTRMNTAYKKLCITTGFEIVTSLRIKRIQRRLMNKRWRQRKKLLEQDQNITNEWSFVNSKSF